MERTTNTASPEIMGMFINGFMTDGWTLELGSDIITYASQNLETDLYTYTPDKDQAITTDYLITDEFGIDDPTNKTLTFRIEPTDGFSQAYPNGEVRLYWESSGISTTTNQNDQLVVELATPIHTIFGAGIVNVIDPDYLETDIPNMFNPPLDSTITYLFKITNGWIQPEGTIGANANVDIAWLSEIDTAEVDRTYLSEDEPDTVAVRVKTVSDIAAISWVSAEQIYTGTVNHNNIDDDYQLIIESPPQLEPGIIFGSNPYSAEIIPGTIVCNGYKVPNDRVSLSLSIPDTDDIYPGIETQTAYKVAMVRGSGDFDYLPNTTAKTIIGIYDSQDAITADYTEGVEYVYAIDPGQTYSNQIEWGAGAPATDAVYYVDYTYDVISRLKIDATCTHEATETIKHIYRSAAEKYSGTCNVNTTFVSDVLDLADFTIDDDVEPSTIRFVLYDNNPRVNAYINSENRVEANLGNYNPRLNWHPYIQNGYYFINDNKYYMYNDKGTYTLDNTLMTMSANINYVSDDRNKLSV